MQSTLITKTRWSCGIMTMPFLLVTVEFSPNLLSCPRLLIHHHYPPELRISRLKLLATAVSLSQHPEVAKDECMSCHGAYPDRWADV